MTISEALALSLFLLDFLVELFAALLISLTTSSRLSMASFALGLSSSISRFERFVPLMELPSCFNLVLRVLSFELASMRSLSR